MSLTRALSWYMRFRGGYSAPSGGRVRCTRGRSVLFGEVHSDNGDWIQVMVEGQTLVTLAVGPGAWTVDS